MDKEKRIELFNTEYLVSRIPKNCGRAVELIEEAGREFEMAREKALRLGLIKREDEPFHAYNSIKPMKDAILAISELGKMAEEAREKLGRIKHGTAVSIKLEDRTCVTFATEEDIQENTLAGAIQDAMKGKEADESIENLKKALEEQFDMLLYEPGETMTYGLAFHVEPKGKTLEIRRKGKIIEPRGENMSYEDKYMKDYVEINSEFANALRKAPEGDERKKLAELASGHFCHIWGGEGTVPVIDEGGMMKFSRGGTTITGPDTLSRGMLEIAALSLELAMAEAGVMPLERMPDDEKISLLLDEKTRKRALEAMESLKNARK